MKKNKHLIVPKATLQRYPIYLKALRNMKSHGIDRVKSSTISEYVDIEPTTIRRDFSFLGSLGKQGYGYDVDYLIEEFENQLGFNFKEEMVLIGCGNLGKALLNYNRWNHVVGKISCGFDIDPKIIDEKADFPIYHFDKFKEKMPENCRIAILTAQKNNQQIVDKLVECGIIGIIDFTNGHFIVPKSVIVKPVDVVSAIQELVFAINFK